jgi:hypothetical protein
VASEKPATLQNRIGKEDGALARPRPQAGQHMVDDVQPGKIAGRRGRFGGSDVGVAPGTRGISLSAGAGLEG